MKPLKKGKHERARILEFFRSELARVSKLVDAKRAEAVTAWDLHSVYEETLTLETLEWVIEVIEKGDFE